MNLLASIIKVPLLLYAVTHFYMRNKKDILPEQLVLLSMQTVRRRLSALNGAKTTLDSLSAFISPAEEKQHSKEIIPDPDRLLYRFIQTVSVPVRLLPPPPRWVTSCHVRTRITVGFQLRRFTVSTRVTFPSLHLSLTSAYCRPSKRQRKGLYWDKNLRPSPPQQMKDNQMNQI